MDLLLQLCQRYYNGVYPYGDDYPLLPASFPCYRFASSLHRLRPSYLGIDFYHFFSFYVPVA